MPHLSLDPKLATPIGPIGIAEPNTEVGESLLTIRDELRLMLQRPENEISNIRLDRWINYAYVDMAGSLDIEELKSSFEVTLAADNHAYLLPADVRVIENASRLEDDTDRGTIPLTLADLTAYRNLSNTTGPVEMVVRRNRVLAFWPTPNDAAVVQLDVIFLPDPLARDTDSPVFSRDLHEPLLMAAAARAYFRLHETESEMKAWAQYKILLRSKLDPRARERAGQIGRVSIPRKESHLSRYRGYR